MYRHRPLDERTQTVLAFMAAYERFVAPIDEPLVDIELTMTEINVVRQLDPAADGSTSPAICDALRMDPAQLSRALFMLREHRLIDESREPYDRRIKRLRLTREGEDLFATINRRLGDEVGAWLATYSGCHHERMLAAMHTLSVVLRGRRTDLAPGLGGMEA